MNNSLHIGFGGAEERECQILPKLVLGWFLSENFLVPAASTAARGEEPVKQACSLPFRGSVLQFLYCRVTLLCDDLGVTLPEYLW